MGEKPHKTWRKTFKKYLRSTLHAHESDLWFIETLSIVGTWQHTQDDDFTREERWEDFLKLDLESPYTQYQVGVKSQSETSPRNMFDLLNADFYDQRSPIGKLIFTFTTMFLKQFKREIGECVWKKNKDEAETWLLSLSTLITKFGQVLATTTLTLYENISLLLQRRRADLEGLLLAHLVRGELYRLIEDLAAVSQAGPVQHLLALATQDPSHVQSSWTRYHFSPPIERACKEIKVLLLAFSASENFYERRALLFRMTDVMNKATDSEELKQVMVAWAIVKTEAFILPAQMFATKQFLVDGPESLGLYFKAIAELVQDGA